MVKSFEEVLIKKINEAQDGVDKYDFEMTNPKLDKIKLEFYTRQKKDYERDVKLLSFVMQVHEALQLEIDAENFRRIVATFYSDTVSEVMSND